MIYGRMAASENLIEAPTTGTSAFLKAHSPLPLLLLYPGVVGVFYV